MSIQNNLLSTSDSHEIMPNIRFLEDAIFRAARVVNRTPREQADLAAAAWVKPSPGPVATSSDLVFFRTVRENLNAAAWHAEMGHEAPSFRECSRPMCRDARNLIPSLVQPGATDAELHAIFDRVLARCVS